MNSLRSVSLQKDDIIQYWHVLPRKFFKLQWFNKTSSTKTRIQERLNLANYILYVSRIEHPGKNHLGLIKAYELLLYLFEADYKLVLAALNGREPSQLRTMQTNLQMPSGFFLPAFVTHEELASLYKHASLFVFPSFSEGFGLPLLEASVSQSPVLCEHNLFSRK
jgi:glycosyltransferase involved in cell wall biosynthesis